MLARASVCASTRLVARRVVYGPAATVNTRSFFNTRFFSAEPAEDAAEVAEKAEQKIPGKITKRVLDELPVQYADISRAHVAIRDGVVRTECKRSHFISELVGANVYLKTEQRQFTGSFKERGARNAILQLIQSRGDEFKKTGAIAASAGNHALAMAYHGKQLGVPITVVMPTVAPLAKVDKCRVRILLFYCDISWLCNCSAHTLFLLQKFGARIIIHGAHIGEAKEFAETLVENEKLTYVNGYDDPPIIAGAGTIGIEMIDDVPNVDAVVVPVGGAGLIAGIACAVKTLKPDTRVSRSGNRHLLVFAFVMTGLTAVPLSLRLLEWNLSSVPRTLLRSWQASPCLRM